MLCHCLLKSSSYGALDMHIMVNVIRVQADRFKCLTFMLWTVIVSPFEASKVHNTKIYEYENIRIRKHTTLNLDFVFEFIKYIFLIYFVKFVSKNLIYLFNFIYEHDIKIHKYVIYQFYIYIIYIFSMQYIKIYRQV